MAWWVVASLFGSCFFPLLRVLNCKRGCFVSFQPHLFAVVAFGFCRSEGPRSREILAAVSAPLPARGSRLRLPGPAAPFPRLPSAPRPLFHCRLRLGSVAAALPAGRVCLSLLGTAGSGPEPPRPVSAPAWGARETRLWAAPRLLPLPSGRRRPRHRERGPRQGPCVPPLAGGDSVTARPGRAGLERPPRQKSHAVAAGSERFAHKGIFSGAVFKFLPGAFRTCFSGDCYQRENKRDKKELEGGGDGS